MKLPELRVDPRYIVKTYDADGDLIETRGVANQSSRISNAVRQTLRRADVVEVELHHPDGTSTTYEVQR